MWCFCVLPNHSYGFESCVIFSIETTRNREFGLVSFCRDLVLFIVVATDHGIGYGIFFVTVIINCRQIMPMLCNCYHYWSCCRFWCNSFCMLHEVGVLCRIYAVITLKCKLWWIVSLGRERDRETEREP